MSKLKARINFAVADDLGVELSSKSITIKELASNPDLVNSLIFAFIESDQVFYDTVPLQRSINGMRIKIPRFCSLPIIEGRLDQQLYQRFYVLGNGILIPLKVTKPNELKTRLLFKIGNDPTYQTTITLPSETMALRKKPLLTHRRTFTYEY